MSAAVAIVEQPEQIQALTHPLRQDVIEALREPDSAAGVARVLERPRQQVNYHLKELARLGLVRPAGERRKGNFIEQLYQAAARRFLVSPRFGCDQAQLAAALRDQIALSNLAELGERLQTDAAALIDQAIRDGGEVPSATAVAEVRFAGANERGAFLAAYTEALRALLTRYGSDAGEAYRVTLAAYPEPEDT